MKKIAVIGLGYVGLPLAVALARHFDVKGFDINQSRISALRNGEDCTGEVSRQVLQESSLFLTDQAPHLSDCNIFIVTVPTPIDINHKPDLNPLRKACHLIGPLLKTDDIVVFESTVYPGVTEKICGPLLEETSGLKAGVNFYLGYSPERINPGDAQHSVERMIKVVAGQNADVEKILTHVYGCINGDKIFVAKNIAVAEAAKVIENAQRDINVAFINEVTMILNALDLSIYDVLAAAETKWNFLPFKPGLVGGHCIGVDPYYLSHCAQELGLSTDMILAGRRINESMSHFIASRIMQTFPTARKILVLGLTFKENIPDLRNTKVVDMIDCLKQYGCEVYVHDAMADAAEAKDLYNLDLVSRLDDHKPYDGVIGAVSHKMYEDLSEQQLNAMICSEGFIADIKHMWPFMSHSKTRYWTL